MLSDAKFLPLRDMESFTEDMFNRIIAFQEQEHPAWNEQLSFEERITGLPLHNFIFSNPNRDPTKSGPTLAHYYPLKKELERLAHYIRQTGDDARVCDIYPGNGIIGSLLGREGIEIFGIKRDDVLPCQIAEFYDNNCYQFVAGNLEEANFNTAFASWMPSGINLTPQLIQKNPDLIIYIFTDHIDPATNKRQVGSEQMLSDLNDDYRLVDNWSITRTKDILHEIWPDMTPSIEETRHTHIYASKSVADIQAYTIDTETKYAYDWEKDLVLTNLAHEAKDLVKSRQF